MSGETGLSFPKVVNIVIREGLIRLGKIPESTSQAHLLVDKPFVEEVQKKTVELSKPKSRPDYSKMSLEDLEKRLDYLREIGDVSEVQFVAFEIKKRLAEKGVKP